MYTEIYTHEISVRVTQVTHRSKPEFLGLEDDTLSIERRSDGVSHKHMARLKF